MFLLIYMDCTKSFYPYGLLSEINYYYYYYYYYYNHCRCRTVVFETRMGV